MNKKPQFSSEWIKGIGAVEDWLPRIGRHVNARVVHLEDGRLIILLRLIPITFEARDDAILQTMFDNAAENLAALGRDLAGKLGIRCYFRRRRVIAAKTYKMQSRWAQRYVDDYQERQQKKENFQNSYHIALVLRYDDFEDGLKQIEALGAKVVEDFRPYQAEIVELVERTHLNGTKMLFSPVYSFIGDLINSTYADMPVSAEPGYEVIPSSSAHFGYDKVEIRGPGVAEHRRFAMSLDLRTFPEELSWGQLNPLLALPMEFTIAQSFDCLSGYSTDRLITSQINKLKSAGDKAYHQIKELEQAQSFVHANQLTFGDYHGAMIVYGSTVKDVKTKADLIMSRSSNECRVGWVLAKASAPYSFYSAVPGAKVKPRPKPQSSRALAAMFSLHDYASGRATGNPIGDGSSVITLEAANGEGQVDFNFHAVRLEGEANFSEKVAGHGELKGGSGEGKSAFNVGALTFFLRFGTKIFALDKGRAMEAFIRAIGGVYFPLEKGKPTGWCPFALAKTPENIDFLYGLVEVCGKKSGTDNLGQQIKLDLTAEEKKQCHDAVDAIMDIEDVSQRRFSLLLQSIPEGDGDSLHMRLANWCRSTKGRFGWVFDSPPSSRMDLEGQSYVGFDMNAFLEQDYEPSEAAFSYMFHIKKQMRKTGETMATVIEEYWLPIRFKTIRQQIEEILASGRKEGEFLILISQHAEQALQDENLFTTMRSLVTTLVLFPDEKAEFTALERKGLTAKEFAAYKKLGKGSRKCMIKQGNQTAFAKFDLQGMDDHLAILSGDRENVLILDQVRAEVGDDPDVWVPIYFERVFSTQLKSRLIAKYGVDEHAWIGIYNKALAEKRATLRAQYPAPNADPIDSWLERFDTPVAAESVL
jgi:type IV secretion system protein VirB4